MFSHNEETGIPMRLGYLIFVGKSASQVRNTINAFISFAGKDLYFYGLKPPNCGNRGWYLLGADPKKTGSVAAKKPLSGYGLLPDGRVQVDGGLVPIERDDYCVDAMQADAETTPVAYTGVMLACRLAAGVADAAGPLEFREILYGIYFVVGTIFLAATLLIYAVLPELRVTVHSGNLMAHTVCLFVSYATLAATTLVRQLFNNCACIIAGNISYQYLNYLPIIL